MEKEKPIYCGKGRTINEYLVSLNICLDDIPAEHKQVWTNGKTYLRLSMFKRREPDNKGNDHSISVNTYKSAPRDPNTQDTPY